MFGLEVHRMPFTINLPLTPPVGQYPNDFKVVGLRMESIKGLMGRGSVLRLVGTNGDGCAGYCKS